MITKSLPLPVLFREALSDAGMRAIDDWWADLDESSRSEALRLWQDCRHSENEFSIRIEARFVEQPDEDSAEFWHSDYYDYLVNHEVYLFDVKGVHICTQHPLAAAAVRSGVIPHDFRCPFQSGDCPMPKSFERSSGKLIALECVDSCHMSGIWPMISVRSLSGSLMALVMILALAAFAAGCSSMRNRSDSFASLHDVIQWTLADGSVCGPIETNEFLGHRYFEVRPQPTGLLVTVSEKPFYSQKEWERLYVAGTNQMNQFWNVAFTNWQSASNLLTDPKMAKLFQESEGWNDLPSWRYQNIGVEVGVQEIDETYPGLEKDDAEAQKRYQKIVKLLVPYLQGEH